MARPNDAGALAGHVQGLKEAKAVFQALPVVARDAMLGATETTVREIARNAQANLLRSPSVQTRNLHNAVAWRVTKTNGRGRVGITSGSTVIRTASNVRGTMRNVRVKGIITAGASGGAAGGRVDVPARRAHFVEFGTRRMRAEPFMIPAAERERMPALQRYVRAGKVVEQKAADIGLRGSRAL